MNEMMDRSSSTSDVIIPQYEIAAPISQGDIFDVFLAYHSQFAWAAAIKVLKSQYLSDQAFVQQVFEQLKVASLQVQPNIALTYDVGFTDSGRPYSAMALIEGISLDKKLDRLRQGQGHLSDKDAILMGLGIAEGLAVLRRAGLTHPNLLPEHVVVQRDNSPVIVGLGNTRHLNSELVIGEEFSRPDHHTAPETIDENVLDEKSNIYSLGVILYELFTTSQWEKSEYLESIESLTPLVEIRPDLSEETCSVVDKCLSKDVDARFQSWSELITALNLALNVESAQRGEDRFIAGRVLALREMTQDRKRINYAIISILIIMGLCLTILLIYPSREQGDGIVEQVSSVIGSDGAVGLAGASEGSILIELLRPANKAALELNDNTEFWWCWSGNLEENEQFALYFDLGTIRRKFDFFPEDLNDLCYKFPENVSELSGSPGEYQWHIGVYNSETGRVIAESESREISIFVMQEPNTSTPTATQTPTSSATVTASPTDTPTFTPTPTPEPTETSTPRPTATDTPEPTAIPPSLTPTDPPPPPQPTSPPKPPPTSTPPLPPTDPPPKPPTATPPLPPTDPPPQPPTATAVIVISSSSEETEHR